MRIAVYIERFFLTFVAFLEAHSSIQICQK